MTVIEGLLAGGGALLVSLLAFFKIRGDRAVKAADDARAREDAAAGRLQRNEAATTAGAIIEAKAEVQRRAREAADAVLEERKASAAQAWDAERRRTETAAARGPEALGERVNEAIREGRLPKGKPQ